HALDWQSNQWTIKIHMQQLNAVRIPALQSHVPRLLTERGQKHAFSSEYELYAFANKHNYRVHDATSAKGREILAKFDSLHQP
ncbi:MAG: hypothetical protein ACHQX3_08730, partial [Nitrospirales bacterium]